MLVLFCLLCWRGLVTCIFRTAQWDSKTSLFSGKLSLCIWCAFSLNPHTYQVVFLTRVLYLSYSSEWKLQILKEIERKGIENCLSSLSSEKNTVLTFKRRKKFHAFVHFLLILFFAVFFLSFPRPTTESWSLAVCLSLC